MSAHAYALLRSWLSTDACPTSEVEGSEHEVGFCLLRFHRAGLSWTQPTWVCLDLNSVRLAARSVKRTGMHADKRHLGNPLAQQGRA